MTAWLLLTTLCSAAQPVPAPKAPQWVAASPKQAYQSPQAPAGQDWKVAFEKQKIGYALRGIHISPDGATVSSVDSGHGLVLWDVATGQIIGRLLTFAQSSQHAWSPDGRHIVFGNSQLWLLDVKTKQAVEWLDCKLGGTNLTRLEVSADGKFLLTVNNMEPQTKEPTATIRLWDFKTRQLVRTYKESGYVYGAAFARSHLSLFFWMKSNGIPRLRNLANNKDEPLEAVADYHPWTYFPALDGNDAVCYWYSFRDEGLLAYDMKKGKKLFVIPGDIGQIHNWTVVSGDGRWALTGTENRRLLLWNLQAKKVEREYRGHPAGLRNLLFTPDKASIVTRDVAGTIYRWDLPKKKER
jgi:WD40 repeat protein